MKKKFMLIFMAVFVFVIAVFTTNVYASTAPAWINGKYTRSVSRISW